MKRMIQIDMPMPKNCANCCFATAKWINGIITLFCMTQTGKRMYAHDLISREDRPGWCPLKEQEAVEPINSYGTFRCGNCGNIVGYNDGHGRGYQNNFCSKCGKMVKWDA